MARTDYYVAEKEYVALVDGTCTKNGEPGAAGGGSYIVYDISSIKQPAGTYLFEDMKYLPTFPKVLCEQNFKLAKTKGRMTNNIAEARSMQLLVADSVKHNLLGPNSRLSVFGDSKLIINQLLGIWSISTRALVDIHTTTTQLLESAIKQHDTELEKMFTLTWVSGNLMKKTEIGH